MKNLLLFIFCLMPFFVFAQKKQKVNIVQTLQAEARKYGCIGVSVEYSLNFTFSPNDIVPDSLKNSSGEKNLKYDVLLHIKNADTKEQIGKINFSTTCLLVNAEKTEKVEFFIPYAYTKLVDGKFTIECELQVMNKTEKMAVLTTPAMLANVPPKIKVAYTVKKIEIKGADWDITNPFSSNSEYADVYVLFTLGSYRVFKSQVSSNASSLNGSFETKAIEICQKDEVCVSFYDEDTIFDDLIDAYYIKHIESGKEKNVIVTQTNSSFEMKKQVYDK